MEQLTIRIEKTIDAERERVKEAVEINADATNPRGS